MGVAACLRVAVVGAVRPAGGSWWVASMPGGLREVVVDVWGGKRMGEVGDDEGGGRSVKLESGVTNGDSTPSAAPEAAGVDGGVDAVSIAGPVVGAGVVSRCGGAGLDAGAGSVTAGLGVLPLVVALPSTVVRGAMAGLSMGFPWG